MSTIWFSLNFKFPPQEQKLIDLNYISSLWIWMCPPSSFFNGGGVVSEKTEIGMTMLELESARSWCGEEPVPSDEKRNAASSQTTVYKRRIQNAMRSIERVKERRTGPQDGMEPKNYGLSPFIKQNIILIYKILVV